MIILHIVAFMALLIGGYLIGAIPFGLVIGRLFFDVDVRETGSGNVGTTNVTRVLGTKVGAAVLVCDMLKGYIPAAIGAAVFGPWPAVIIAAGPVVGHMYSIFLKGRGGKGIATGGGVILALVPVVFVIIATVWVVLLVTTRYVSVASLIAAFLVPVLTIGFGEPLPYKIAAVVVAALVWWAHRGNIARLLAGDENRATMPWTAKSPGSPGPYNGG